MSLNSQFFALDNEPTDGVLGAVVVDRQMPTFDVAHQPVPVACQVVHHLAQGGLPGDLWLDLVQPGFELVELWLAALQTGGEALAVVSIFQVALDAVELVDQVQGHVGTAGLTFGLHLLCFDDLRRACAQQVRRSIPSCADTAL